jgi:hypothetical protein
LVFEGLLGVDQWAGFYGLLFELSLQLGVFLSQKDGSSINLFWMIFPGPELNNCSILVKKLVYYQKFLNKPEVNYLNLCFSVEIDSNSQQL